MKISKSTSLGWYSAEQQIGGNWYHGSGHNHTEALLDLFATLKWNLIGNWSPFQHQAEEDLEIEAVKAEENG